MKFDFSNSTLTDLISGKQMVEQVPKEGPNGQEVFETVPVTVLAVSFICMLRPTPDDNKLSLTEKIRRYKLGQKLMTATNGSSKIVELDAEEVALIKATVGVMFGAMIVGQVVDFFESASNRVQETAS